MVSAQQHWMEKRKVEGINKWKSFCITFPNFIVKQLPLLSIKTQSHGVTPWQFRKNSWLAGFSSTDFKGVTVDFSEPYWTDEQLSPQSFFFFFGSTWSPWQCLYRFDGYILKKNIWTWVRLYLGESFSVRTKSFLTSVMQSRNHWMVTGLRRRA